MRKNEQRYEFRKKLLEIHKKDVRDINVKISENELEITDGFIIDISKAYTEVVLTGAKDFQDYLLISMNVSVLITKKEVLNNKNCVRVLIDAEGKNLGLANGYMGYKIEFDDGILITAKDERGALSAFFYLEDLMTLKKAPFILKKAIERKPLFSPRMIHSGFALDNYPNEHLRAISHSGMDAILVFTKDVNLTPNGFLDFNELIFRAKRYGIDVYAYSYLKSKMHPEDAGAEEYYESTYGKLFKMCPGLKGVVLVGESVAFPSRDPKTSGTTERTDANGLPTQNIHPGWWPCEDYPDWLNLLKKIIRKYNEGADIVFWTYNWCSAPEEDRIKLINSLPKDISLLVTFEMAEYYDTDKMRERAADYTLSIAGPGNYFLSEAKAAKENGIRLYSMTNTGGLTWDFGTVPFEPFPNQWQKRCDKIIECHEKYGLSGLMESHHYGFYPSFISELVKWNFTEESLKRENILSDILSSYFGKENAEKTEMALKLWSEAINFYFAAAPDQYGAFRIGPAYPLCLLKRLVPKAMPYASSGTGIMEAKYDPYNWISAQMADLSLPSIKIHYHIESLEKMKKLLSEGIEILESIVNKNDELLELIDLGKYINCTVKTAICAKRFVMAKTKIDGSSDPREIKKQIKIIEELALSEIENAKSAIPLVQKNSRLGWEPTMEYLGDEEYINWKIKQVEYMLKSELETFKECIKHNLSPNTDND